MVRVGRAVGLAGVQRFVPRLGLANRGDEGVVLAGNELVVLPRPAEQAPVGLGEFALHGDGFLRDFEPAQLGQQRADEAVFQLRFAVSGQGGGLKMRGKPRIECVGQRQGGQLVGLLNNKAVIKQRVGQPVLREEVLFMRCSIGKVPTGAGPAFAGLNGAGGGYRASRPFTCCKSSGVSVPLAWRRRSPPSSTL